MELGRTIEYQYFSHLIPFQLDLRILLLLTTSAIAVAYLLILRKRLKHLSTSIISAPANKSRQSKIKRVRPLNIKIIETSRTTRPTDIIKPKNRFCNLCGEKINIHMHYCDRCGEKQ